MEDFWQLIRLVARIRESGIKLKEAKVPKIGTGANIEGFDDESKDEDVEAHGKITTGGTVKTGATSESTDEKDDDVEAHIKLKQG